MPKNTTEKCCEGCKALKSSVEWGLIHPPLPHTCHKDSCFGVPCDHEGGQKCAVRPKESHTTTANGWEEEFEARFTDRHGLQLARGNADELKAFIQHIAKEEYERGRKDERKMFIGVLGDFVRTYSVNAPQEPCVVTFSPKQFMTTFLFRIDDEEQRLLREKFV